MARGSLEHSYSLNGVDHALFLPDPLPFPVPAAQFFKRFRLEICAVQSVLLQHSDKTAAQRFAGVSELADEADSKSVDRKAVRVRFPPPA